MPEASAQNAHNVHTGVTLKAHQLSNYLAIQTDMLATSKCSVYAGDYTGLVLEDVEPGLYELQCLPMKLVNSDGAPTRCILR